MPHSARRAFTLIELLIVIAVIAILATVVILTLNPAELLAESRDSGRLSDMKNLDQAISLYEEDTGGNLGVASTTYVSIPDPAATSSAGTDCASLGLPALPAGDVYHCAGTQWYRNVDGTGWIPLDFSSASCGSPMGSLPVDPVNATSSGLYYTYTTNGTQYELTAIMESQKYKTQLEDSPTLTDYPGVDAEGDDLALSALYNPSGLAGYWPLDEGSGSTAKDESGNGNNGTWNGTTPYYTTSAKVGAYAGNFNGSNDQVELTNSGSSSYTITAWFVGAGLLGLGNIAGSTGRYVTVNASTGNIAISTWGGGYGVSSTQFDVNIGSWNFIAIEPGEVYVNGVGQTINFGNLFDEAPGNMSIGGNYDYGGNGWNFVNGAWDGRINDVRIYNRALSAAEIQAIYNAEK